MQLAKAVLDEGVAVLRSLGIYSSVLVQSDGGSDFTGEVFQNACLRYGSWIRCKVSQRGGMGILERLNQTYKYAFAFRNDWKSLADVQAALPNFHRWYNRERRHSASALGYGTPWATLTRAVNPHLAA